MRAFQTPSSTTAEVILLSWSVAPVPPVLPGGGSRAFHGATTQDLKEVHDA
jgi:hypothetical protein